MITIKLKIIEDISKELFPFKKKWNNIYRYAFNILNWVELHNLIKKTKTSYRFLYKDFIKSQQVLRFESRQSLVDKCLCFI